MVRRAVADPYGLGAFVAVKVGQLDLLQILHHQL
jgi:hypothetical protein